ncbi:MAG TPA: DUF5947 family protein [Chloroflexota bacterium]|nr:DUF5947 family protein [Chloroflexota bacterium]
MIGERARPFGTLQRFAQRAARAAAAAQERCDVCGELVAPAHRHLLTIATREIQCVCRACGLLFGSAAASEGRYRLVSERRLYLADFAMDTAQWDSLRVPVGIAFFFYSTPAGRQVAYYPSPAGPVESLLRLDTWDELQASNPLLRQVEPDVEALLVNRARGTAQHYLAPIDDCYSLVGLVRRHWRGLGGGPAVWGEIGRFFEALQARATAVRREP